MERTRRARRTRRREVSLVEHCELNFRGSILQSALALGDTDNDGYSEFVAGNLEGRLCIYKGARSRRPRFYAKGLGTITCVCVGDVFNQGRKFTVVVTAEGRCHIFDVATEASTLGVPVTTAATAMVGNDKRDRGGGSALELEERTPDDASMQRLVPTVTCSCPWNAHHCLLVDFDSDGVNKLVLGTHAGDVPARVYVLHLVRREKGEGSWTLEPTAEHDMPADVQSLSTCRPRPYTRAGSNTRRPPLAPPHLRGPLRSPQRVLLVGLLFGGFVAVGPAGVRRVATQHPQQHQQHPKQQQQNQHPKQQQMQQKRGISGITGGASAGSALNSTLYSIQNPQHRMGPMAAAAWAQKQQVEQQAEEQERGEYIAQHTPSTVLGGIGDAGGGASANATGGLVAQCSLGGLLRLQRLVVLSGSGGMGAASGIVGGDEERGKLFDELVWQEQLSAQLFALQAVDITGDASQEIVSCAWDGLTSIYDQRGNAVRFKFESPEGRVAGFLAGNFAVEPGADTRPCFFYATLSGRIVVYTGVALEIRAVSAYTLMDVLRRRGQLSPALSVLDTKCDVERKRAFRAQALKLLPSERAMKDTVRSRAIVRAWQAQLLHGCLYASAAESSRP